MPTTRQSRGGSIAATLLLVMVLAASHHQALGQLPDDIQRELNDGLAEQAKLQAIREQQQLLRARQAGAAGRSAGPSNRLALATPTHAGQQPADPNNYSFQQVSPPVQYSYFQPYGDTGALGAGAGQPQAGQQQHQQQQVAAKPMPKMDFDLNNLSFELPKPQARQAQSQADGSGYNDDQSPQQPSRAPQFVGVAGLPLMEAGNSAPPPAPQARAAAGPQAQPLTEADFRDITGGENYGAPGGGSNDFGLGGGSSGPSSRGGGIMDDPFGGAGFGLAGQGANPNQRRANNNNLESSLEALAGDGPARAMGGQNNNNNNNNDANEFDFASQPSRLSNQDDAPSQLDQTGGEDGQVGGQADATGARSGSSSSSGAPPSSLESLLGGGFPGLSGSPSRSSWQNQLQQQPERAPRPRQDPTGMDMADLGERADGFAGADLGGFGQPQQPAGGEQDFQLAGAAASPQPSSVPYPDAGPQFVGTLLAVTQPQSLSQTRYSPLPDHGSFQDYPGYQAGGNNFDLVAGVVDATPRARRAAPGRYGAPAPSSLAPELRPWLPRGRVYDYSQAPAISALQQLY